jgi:hypothetical protein
MTFAPETRQLPRSAIAAAALAVLTLLASAARAQESGVATPLASPDPRLSDALEIAVGIGSAQGYGKVLGGGPSLEDLGVGLDVAVGWRLNPRWMIGSYSSTGMYPAATGTSTWSTSAGLQANYHFEAPFKPWIGLGAGWHGYWLSQSGSRTSYQGLDLVRAQAGVQAAVTQAFSLEPFVGMTLSTFLSQKASSAAAFTDVKDRAVSVQVLAGVIGRFDLFGHSGAPAALLASNQAN